MWRTGKLLIVAAAMLACGTPDPRAEDYAYRPPQQLRDGIPVADATILDIDQARIETLVRQFRSDQWGKHTSLLVMKDGKLIVEEYFSGWKRKQRHTMQSVSKSITSLMAGFAIDRGFIRSVDDPISMYLPKYRHLLTDGKERITIRHLLTMTSGLEWNEHQPPYSDTANMRQREMRSDDGVAFVLSQPLAHEPGTVWRYNGGGVTLLCEIIKNASQLSYDDLIGQAFRGLLDGREIQPSYQEDGRMNTAGGFFVTPRGMIKIGQMLMDGGAWNGSRIFDQAWIDESTRPAKGDSTDGYGYLWWLNTIEFGDTTYSVVAAMGLGGQRIVVLEGLRLVVVLTAVNYEDPGDLKRIMLEAILPALSARDMSSVESVTTSSRPQRSGD